MPFVSHVARAAFRISKRHNDPKRREALLNLLQSSTAAPVVAKPSKPESAAPPPRRPLPAEVPALSLSENVHKSSAHDEARKLNRGVMWEELMKQAAEACVCLCD